MKLTEDQKRQVREMIGIEECPNCKRNQLVIDDYVYYRNPVKCDPDDFRCTPLQSVVVGCLNCGLQLFFAPPDPWHE